MRNPLGVVDRGLVGQQRRLKLGDEILLHVVGLPRRQAALDQLLGASEVALGGLRRRNTTKKRVN